MTQVDLSFPFDSLKWASSGLILFGKCSQTVFYDAIYEIRCRFSLDLPLIGSETADDESLCFNAIISNRSQQRKANDCALGNGFNETEPTDEFD